ncbi:alpha/beta-hydrolase [Rhizodiscina lignyota]|uniref:Alpha/beta-hydrolase n=1 Tax=Rhizodiscina lignyota TaxID=1504668 RepID=A0A9P4IRM3_9PEZI|nr:alpha/beta-hydrolase [Rhizodiscina lignyota]
MSHSYLSYIRLKALATLLRAATRFTNPRAKAPDDTFYIDSSSTKRKIKINVYRPATPRKPSPVVINWVATGFMMDSHGADEGFCQYIAKNSEYTVLDASYTLAPENPFPAALEDVADTINYVFSKPEEYDTNNVVLSGFSSGANLAFSITANRESAIPRDRLRSIMTFYSVLDWSTPPAEKKAPYGGAPTIPPFLLNILADCYVPPGVDRADPRVSPARADPHDVPQNILTVTCAKDSLALEAEEFTRKAEAAGKKVTIKRLDDVDHAFDKQPVAWKEGTKENERREEAYSAAVKFLQEVYESS